MPKSTVVRRIDLSRASGGGGGVLSGGGGTTYTTDHGALSGLGDDDHAQYLTNARGDARYAPLTRTLTAGNGLTGGGTLAADRTFALTTPGTLTVGTSNSAAGAHTHAVAASDTVSAAQTALLKATAGALTVATFGATTSVTTPSLLSSGTLTISPGTYAILSDGKSLRTNTFTTGFVGSGFRLDQGVSTAGRTTLEVDDLWVRGRMNVYELLIHQIRATNGSIFVSSTGKITGIVDNGGGSYSFTCEGGHGFAGGDIIRAQRWNGASSSLYQSNMHVSYVPAPTLTTFTASLQSGDTPTLDMEFVRLGNLSVADRRGGIYMTADDSGAPFLDVFDDVDSLSDWNTATALKMRLGNLNGFYGYGSRTYGLAAGTSGGTAVTVDSTNGFRILRGTTARLQADTSGNVYLRNASGDAVISLLSSGASEFSGPMTLGSGGGIYQGSSGTFASPNTGLKLWNASGNGALALYSGGASPILTLNSDGISVRSTDAFADNLAYTFSNGTSIYGGVYGRYDDYTAEVGFKVATSNRDLQSSVYLSAGAGYDTIWGALCVSGSSVASLYVDGANSRIEVVATRFDYGGVVAPTLSIGDDSVSTGTCSLQIGDGRTGNGYAVFDMVGDATYTDYGFRILRGNSGANTTTQIYHRGTGNFEWVAQDAAALLFKTAATTRMSIGSAGEVAIGTTPQSGWELYVSGNLGVTGVINGPLRMAGTAPATSSSSGSVGDMRYNGTHLFICVATNSWRRVALSTF